MPDAAQMPVAARHRSSKNSLSESNQVSPLSFRPSSITNARIGTLRALSVMRQDGHWGSDTGTLQRNSDLCIPRKGIARGLSSNFHVHVSVSDLYIPTIGPPRSTYFPAAE
jgi:hypothetical protein